ncbi:MAG: serine hydrolase domain-containing protein [Xanthomonadales bacterium]|nr:serine hydrolase domain-containing protein [Xanthomonadales bacterium]
MQHLDHQLARLQRDPNMVGLSVCAGTSSGIVYQRFQGPRQRGSRQLVDADTRFRVASLSKGFAATLALMLSGEQAVRLTEPVTRHVDYFQLKQPDQSARVQLQHLLSHQVGLPHYAYDKLLEANWSPENIIRRLDRVDMTCPVGTCYGYQNTAYNMMTHVIESVTGESFERQVENRVFRPMGMSGTGFGKDHLVQDDNWARPHIGRYHRLRPVDVKTNYYQLPASAGVNASADDMCRWLAGQLGGRPEVLSQELLALSRAPRVETRRELYRGRWRRARVKSAHYGMGWRVYDYAGEPMVFHAGSVQGYGATIALLPERDVGLMALWNSETSRPWAIVPTFVDAYLGLKPVDWMKLDELEAAAGTSRHTGD